MTERSKSMSTKGMDIKQSMRTHIRSNDFLFFPGDPNFWYRHKLRWWCVYFDDRSSFSRIPSRLSEKILCIDLEECNNIDLDKSIGAWLKEFQRVNGDKPYYYDRSPVEFRIVQPSQSPITTVSIRSNTRSNNNIRRDQQRSTNIVNIRTNCNAPSSNMISPMMPFFAPPIHSHSIYCHPLAQMRMSQQAIMQNCMIQSQLLLQQMQSGVMLQRQEMINQDKQNERKYQDKREERNHQERMLMLRQNTKSSNTGNITNNITVNGAATFNIKLGPVGLGSFLEKLIAEKAHSHDTEGVNYLKEKLTNFQAVKSSPHDVRRVPFKTLDDIDTSNRNLSGIRRSILDVRRFNTLKHFSGLGDYFTMDGTANQEGFDQDIPFSISTKLLSQLRHQNSDENCVITSISNALHFCAPKDDMVNQFASAVVKQRDVTYFTHERVNGADSAFIAQNIYVEHQKQTKYAKYTILQSLYYSKKSY